MPNNNEPTPNYKLRDARIDKNLTQAELAEKLGVSVRTVQRWENGENCPQKNLLEQICKFFSMTEEELGFTQGKPPTQETEEKQTEVQPEEQSSEDQRKLIFNVLNKRYKDKLDELEERRSGKDSISLELHEYFGLTPPNPGQSQRTSPRPEGTTIVDVYDQLTRGLLILGKPGTGKTTLLYHLASVLLERAEQDESRPLPIILNLSSWAEEKLPLRDWIVKELETGYRIPRKLGQRWLDDRFQLFLDGLDEVGAEARYACIDVINTYHMESSLSFVVCSREEEYVYQDAPAAELAVQSTIIVQPLTPEQIDTYLADPSLTPIREEVRTNPTFCDLLKTPLMLNTAVAAYRGQASEQFPEGSTTTTLKRQMFTSYLNQMLLGLEKQARMRRQLRWLAQRMQEHKLSVFYLEQLQPDWLPEGGLRGFYVWLGVRLPGILIGFLLACLANSFFMRYNAADFLVHSLPGAIVGGLLSTRYTSQSGPNQLQRRNSSLAVWGSAVFLGVGLAAVLMLADARIDTEYTSIGGPIFGTWSFLLTLLLTPKQPSFPKGYIPTLQLPSLGKYLWNHILSVNPWSDGLLIGLLGGLSWGLFRALTVPANRSSEGITAGMGFALAYTLSGILTGSILIKQATEVPPAEMIDLSPRKFWCSLTDTKRLNTILLVGVSTFLVFGLGEVYHRSIDGLSFVWSYGVNFGVICALGAAANYWFLVGLFHGLSRDTMPDEELGSISNDRIRWSGRNGLRLGRIGGIISGFVAGLTTMLSLWLIPDTSTYTLLWIGKSTNVLINGLHWGMFSGLVTFLTAGIVIGLAKGGMTWWRHWVLCFLLWSDGIIPWHYEDLLEEACRHNLLCKEGQEGYRFFHSLFQDYCASLDADQG